MKIASDSTNCSLRASSAGGLVLLLMPAGAMNVAAAPMIVTNSSISGGPAWEGAVGPSMYGVYGDVVEALLPVAIVCALSLLCMAVWLIAAGAYRQKR